MCVDNASYRMSRLLPSGITVVVTVVLVRPSQTPGCVHQGRSEFEVIRIRAELLSLFAGSFAAGFFGLLVLLARLLGYHFIQILLYFPLISHLLLINSLEMLQLRCLILVFIC